MPSGYTFDSNHGPGVGMSSAGSSGSGGRSVSSSSSGSGSSLSSKILNAAQNISTAVKTNTSLVGEKMREYLNNPSNSARMANLYDGYISNYGNAFDMDEYYDKLMEMASYNNDWSAGQAQKQMDFQRAMANQSMAFENAQAEKQMQYQTRSDQAAMAWSAQEAARSRAWTENLSNTAHQREVKDLLAAGINPILSANNGAWAGSGATGQAYSSSGAMASGESASGAMGSTDMSVSGAFASLASGMLTTARDLAITRINTETQRYAADRQFAAAKMAAETSIYNNNSNIDANKAIRALDRDADIRKASISADATKYAAATSAGAMTAAAATSAAAARYSADQHLEAAEQTAGASRYSANRSYQSTKYKADKDYEIQKLKNESNFISNPAGYLDYMQGTNLGQALDEVSDGLNRLRPPDMTNESWWKY